MKLSYQTLIAIRGNLGVYDPKLDESKDAEIVNMEPAEIVRRYCAWTLGDGSWANRIGQVIQEAYGIELKGLE